MSEHAYREVVDALRADPDVEETKMMGMPSLKTRGKLFAGLHNDGLAVKVGRARAGELIENGEAQPFDPSGRGRPMKDWAHIPQPGDNWLALADEAKTNAVLESG
ncbi:MAG: TfoX/Sxy family protein [Thermoleophilaceae bacterium]